MQKCISDFIGRHLLRIQPKTKEMLMTMMRLCDMENRAGEPKGRMGERIF